MGIRNKVTTHRFDCIIHKNLVNPLVRAATITMNSGGCTHNRVKTDRCQLCYLITVKFGCIPLYLSFVYINFVFALTMNSMFSRFRIAIRITLHLVAFESCLGCMSKLKSCGSH